MSSTVNETGAMWQSEADILKDLAFLNDFDISGNTKQPTIFYSNGRGLNMKRREKSLGKFVDPRTGETIDLNDLELSSDNVFKGKGRGKRLQSFSIAKFQLQEQLRQARPLGSGDEAIESYCRRNRLKENSTSTAGSVANSQNAIIYAKGSTRNLDKPLSRVIGCRSSQNNILISSLLAKAKGNASTEAGAKIFSSDGSFSGFNNYEGNNSDSSSGCSINDENENQHSIASTSQVSPTNGHML